MESSDSARPSHVLSRAVGPLARVWITAVAYDRPCQGYDLGFNLGLHVGDSPAKVMTNRQQLAGLIGADLGLGRPARIAWMDQVHGDRVAQADAGATPQADALLLQRSALVASCADAAAVMVADCLPLVLASDDGALVAAVHAGRRGAMAAIATKTVDQMVERGANASAIHAFIGPHICGKCYEVPADLAAQAAKLSPQAASRTRQDTPAIDLEALVRSQLLEVGLPSANIASEQVCTFENEAYFSYRRSRHTGRFALLIAPVGHAETNP